MSTMLSIIQHVLIAAFLISAIVIFLAAYVGRKYCKFAFFVSKAGTREGLETLAKHLAKAAGGKKADLTQVWPVFVPAATLLYKDHETKRYHHRHK